jgi:hypothetical protein
VRRPMLIAPSCRPTLLKKFIWISPRGSFNEVMMVSLSFVY